MLFRTRICNPSAQCSAHTIVHHKFGTSFWHILHLVERNSCFYISSIRNSYHLGIYKPPSVILCFPQKLLVCCLFKNCVLLTITSTSVIYNLLGKHSIYMAALFSLSSNTATGTSGSWPTPLKPTALDPIAADLSIIVSCNLTLLDLECQRQTQSELWHFILYCIWFTLEHSGINADGWSLWKPSLLSTFHMVFRWLTKNISWSSALARSLHVETFYQSSSHIVYALFPLF